MSFAIVAIAGGVALGAGGAYLGGKAGDAKRKRLNKIANTPGLDIEAISSQAQTNQQKLLPGAEQLVRTEAIDRQSLVNDLAEQSMPGFTASRDRAKGIMDSLLAGEVPKEIQDLVQRQTAANMLGRGTGAGGFTPGSMGGAEWGRNLGLTGLGLQSQGLSWLSTLRGLSPTVAPQSAFNLIPGVSDWLNIRGHERDVRLNTKVQAAVIPGQTEAWGKFLSSTGGTLAGAGMGALGGGGGGGGALAKGAGSSFTMDDYYKMYGGPNGGGVVGSFI